MFYRILLVAGLLLTGLFGCAATQRSFSPTYYLALGDSLTVGAHSQNGTFDPGDRACSNPSLDATGGGGWVCIFASKLHSLYPKAQLTNLALDGEDTCSFLTGKVCGATTRSMNGEGAPPYNPATETQMHAARAFLKTHAGQDGVITLEIGANDVLGLYQLAQSNPQRALAQLPTVVHRAESNDDTIFRRLRASAPNADLLLFDVYNPFAGSTTVPAQLSGAMGVLVDVYAKFLKHEATRYHAVFVDVRSDHLVSSDIIHPSDAGHRKLASLMWRAFKTHKPK